MLLRIASLWSARQTILNTLVLTHSIIHTLTQICNLIFDFIFIFTLTLAFLLLTLTLTRIMLEFSISMFLSNYNNSIISILDNNQNSSTVGKWSSFCASLLTQRHIMSTKHTKLPMKIKFSESLIFIGLRSNNKISRRMEVVVEILACNYLPRTTFPKTRFSLVSGWPIGFRAELSSDSDSRALITSSHGVLQRKYAFSRVFSNAVFWFVGQTHTYKHILLARPFLSEKIISETNTLIDPPTVMFSLFSTNESPWSLMKVVLKVPDQNLKRSVENQMWYHQV